MARLWCEALNGQPGMRLLMGLEPVTALELAHGDLYPPGSPDGVFNLQDMILLQQRP